MLLEEFFCTLEPLFYNSRHRLRRRRRPIISTIFVASFLHRSRPNICPSFNSNFVTFLLSQSASGASQLRRLEINTTTEDFFLLFCVYYYLPLLLPRLLLYTPTPVSFAQRGAGCTLTHTHHPLLQLYYNTRSSSQLTQSLRLDGISDDCHAPFWEMAVTIPD